MKIWKQFLISMLAAMFVASIAWAAGNFYWKDTFTALDAIADSAGDRGIVIQSDGLVAFYYNGGAGWTIGDLSGGTQVINQGVSYTLGTDDPLEAYGSIVRVTAAATITLPAVVIGMTTCVYSTTAATVRINPNASDGIILNGAARQTDGVDIYSSSGAGDFICLFGDSADGWTTLGRSGTWTLGS
jgi:hypothetical protein